MNFLQAIVIAAMCIVPQSTVLRDSVDLAELNHFYDGQGRLVFDQLIWYDWSETDSDFRVVCWRLVKVPEQLPIRDWGNGASAATWIDHETRDLEYLPYKALWSDSEILRQIYARSFRETWPQYDPELVAREKLPKETRRGLTTNCK
jgi:hypothetical protein